MLSPMVFVTAIKLIKILIPTGVIGLVQISQLFLLVLGWGMGWLLAEADHLFYTTVCNPQELTCQRVRKELWANNFAKAWRMLLDTKDERQKLPVRNVLTLAIVAVLGIWIITSSESWLASGVVFGLGVRLFSEISREKNTGKWYWIFARAFSEAEHKLIVGGLGILLAVQFILLINR